MPIDSTDLIWSEGYRAFSQFGETEHNHYLAGSDAYDNWDRGFQDAKDDTFSTD